MTKKKSNFLLGAIIGGIGTYSVVKYILPMVSKEDIIEKLDEMKNSFSESVNKEQLINDFNDRTEELKSSLYGQNNENIKLASDDNFEDIVLDEDSIDFNEK